MSFRIAKYEKNHDSWNLSVNLDSRCSNHLSSSMHSTSSNADRNPTSAKELVIPSSFVPMTPIAKVKQQPWRKNESHVDDRSIKPFDDDLSHTPNSLGMSHATPETTRRGSVGAKISDRVSKFDANPMDGALLRPMQMHASAPSFSIAGPPLSVVGADEEHLTMSPMHIPNSAPSKRRSVRHKKIEMKAQVFDSPQPQDNPATRVLLSPQEVRELVKSSNKNHRLDQILYRYEHLSEEESKERHRISAKIAAKERRRRLGATTAASTEIRRLAWERSRGKFRNSSSSGPMTLSVDKNIDMGDEVFDEVRAISYDFSNFVAPSFSKTEAQRQRILEAIDRDFPFAEFRENGKARTDGAIDALVDAFEPISLKTSEVLLHQGVKEGNDKFYILESGAMDVQQEGVSINQLNNPGESFGQIALMYHAPSNVTISVALSSNVQGSESGAQLLRIDQKTYRGLLLDFSQRARNERILALSKITFLNDLLEGDDKLSIDLASLMVRNEFKAEDDFDFNEESTLFIILSGSLRVSSKDGSCDKLLSAGNFFGGRSLIESIATFSTSSADKKIVALSDGVFFSIDKNTIERIFGKGRLQNLKDMRTLASTALVKKAKLTRIIRENVTSAITEQKLDEEEKKEWKVEIYEEPALYVVREGSVLVSFKDEDSGELCKTEVKAGETFGHKQVKEESGNNGTKFRRIGGLTASILSGKTASIGVIPLKEVGSEGVARTKGSRLELPLTAKKPTNAVTGKASAPTAKRISHETSAIQLRKKLHDAVQNNLTLEQLEKIRLLGEGEFGEVWMVSADVFQTGVPELCQKFALKTQLKRDNSRGKDATADILREIKLLKAVDHPQVVDLVTTFEDEDAIYILMGLIPGGELWDVIHTEDEEGVWRSGMPEDHTKFATMVLADILDFIHSRDIVYRDLKPENVMIDADGYPVLVDFGCSKFCSDKTYTFVGTPNYVAPEIITNAGYNRCVDYWALGVTVYEMFTGENPFFFDGMDPVTLYHAICNEKHYPLSEGTCPELVDFIDRLLQKNPSQRLGMLTKGVDDVFEHPWLQGMDLTRVRSKEWIAPWRAPQGEDKDSEEAVLQKMGMCMATPSLEDSVTSRDVSYAEDSTASLADPSDRDHSMGSIIEEDDAIMESLLKELSKTKKSDKKKKDKKKKGTDGTKRKRR
ncbi:sserine/threonine protein kinase with PASTA sensor domain [Nitzschia inconspicua]|uniref:Sserine/threonine protein kinase with PASTA sensor domain n=1 Tax=Nitzschia inconspicua TaxID=303405 RepID=A0A9K3LP47_9STRA|nr:sserine/threonine protein kinase with PASTA sensor domain [Nitzschia inconspicua]